MASTRAAAPAHIYVYYRVAADSADARARLAAMFADVESATGIIGRILARRDDPALWMEIYEPVADAAAFLRSLAMLARKHGVETLAADDIRHVESFRALPPFPAAPR